MSENEKITIVTVTISNSDGENACASERFDPADTFTLDDIIEGVTESAREAFDGYGFAGLDHRVIVNVNTFPKPKARPGTIVRADLPEQTEDNSPVIVDTKIS